MHFSLNNKLVPYGDLEAKYDVFDENLKSSETREPCIP